MLVVVALVRVVDVSVVLVLVALVLVVDMAGLAVVLVLVALVRVVDVSVVLVVVALVLVVDVTWLAVMLVLVALVCVMGGLCHIYLHFRNKAAVAGWYYISKSTQERLGLSDARARDPYDRG